jgi:hypothetical protein
MEKEKLDKDSLKLYTVLRFGTKEHAIALAHPAFFRFRAACDADAFRQSLAPKGLAI